MGSAHSRRLITWIVSCTAGLAVSWFLGCGAGVFKDSACNNAQDKSLALLAGLLATVTSLAVRSENDEKRGS